MDEISLGALFGVVLPPIVSLLKSRRRPKWANLLMTVLVCLGAGALAAVAEGTLDTTGAIIEDPEELLAGAAAAFTTASVVYRTYFKDTPLNDILTGVGAGH